MAEQKSLVEKARQNDLPKTLSVEYFLVEQSVDGGDSWSIVGSRYTRDQAHEVARSRACELGHPQRVVHIGGVRPTALYAEKKCVESCSL